MGLRQTQGSHHLKSAVHEFFEIETRARWVLRKLKAVQRHPTGHPRRMQSLSLRTAILNSRSLKIAVGEIHSPVASQRESERIRTG